MSSRRVPLWGVVGLVFVGACCKTVAALPKPMPFFPKCPDPTNDCTLSNGTGVYYQEDGSAGITTPEISFLITHFVNDGAEVHFRGRYFDPSANLWKQLPTDGTVAGALFAGERWAVKSIGETGTVPTWTLARQNLVKPVVGDELVGLVLELTLPDPFPVLSATSRSAAFTFRLDFKGQAAPGSSAPVVTKVGNGTTVHGYGMRWGAGAGPRHYCLDASNQPDAVVFQQGIGVNALNGDIIRGDKFVTLSCSLGAPAVVYGWGYDYKAPAADFYFRSAIQMKRAAYCGNRRYFTKTGTSIAIADDASVVHDPYTKEQIEAYWTPKGASCLSKRRHPEIAFNGECDGTPLVACEDLGQVGAPWLLDAIPSP